MKKNKRSTTTSINVRTRSRMHTYKLTLDMLIFDHRHTHKYVFSSSFRLSRLSLFLFNIFMLFLSFSPFLFISPFFAMCVCDYCFLYAIFHIANIMFLFEWPHAENVMLSACNINDIIKKGTKSIVDRKENYSAFCVRSK